jgi:hypothetical protein
MASNNRKWLLGLGIAGGLAWWLSRKSAAVESLRWYIAGVKYDKSSSNITRSLFKITIRVENPTADTVRFDRFTGKVLVQGATLSTLDVTGAGKGIRFAPGNTDIVLDAAVQHLIAISVIKDFVSQITTGNFKEMFTIQGNLYAGGIAIPISETQSASIGKARVSLEFATREEMEDYFQKSNLYVGPGGGNKFSVNGIGNISKKKSLPLSGLHLTRYTMANEVRQVLT